MTPGPGKTATPTRPGTRSESLLAWFRTNRRPLPWRVRPDPYRIWVAEVLLQQTRVAQAVPYYERFVARFPDLRALAGAPRSEVLRAWQGAGYYDRARRLHEAARCVARDRGGRIPGTVEELEQLPGVGRYIARAVASLAYGVPAVALEANGLRVAARWTREEADPRTARARARLEAALARELPPSSPGPFNEAIMELGETICLPEAPRCPACPVSFGCRAYRELDDPASVPRRPAGRHRPHLRAAVVALTERGRWLVQRRPPGGLLGDLWEFPGGRIEPGEAPAHAARRELREETGGTVRRLAPAGVVRHGYSHFTVELHVFRGISGSRRPVTGRTRRWATPDELRRLPLPRATEKIVDRLNAPDRPSPGSGSRRGRTTVSRRPASRRRPGRALRRGTAPSGGRSRARR